MGWLADLFREIPLSVIQEQKIAEMEAKYDATEAEKASLKDDLRQAKAEITKLQKQIEEFTHKDDLEEVEIKVLHLIAVANGMPWAEAIAEQLGLHTQRVEYHLQKLELDFYVLRHYGGGYPDSFSLLQKGRDVLMQRNLI